MRPKLVELERLCDLQSILATVIACSWSPLSIRKRAESASTRVLEAEALAPETRASACEKCCCAESRSPWYHGPVGQERLRLGRGLRLADGEQRVTCLLERVLPSIVPREVK